MIHLHHSFDPIYNSILNVWVMDAKNSDSRSCIPNETAPICPSSAEYSWTFSQWVNRDLKLALDYGYNRIALLIML